MIVRKRATGVPGVAVHLIGPVMMPAGRFRQRRVRAHRGFTVVMTSSTRYFYDVQRTFERAWQVVGNRTEKTA